MRLGSNLLDQRNTLFTLTPKRLATWAKLNFSLLRIDRTFFLKSSEYVIQKIIAKTKYFSYSGDLKEGSASAGNGGITTFSRGSQDRNIELWAYLNVTVTREGN